MIEYKVDKYMYTTLHAAVERSLMTGFPIHWRRWEPGAWQKLEGPRTVRRYKGLLGSEFLRWAWRNCDPSLRTESRWEGVFGPRGPITDSMSRSSRTYQRDPARCMGIDVAENWCQALGLDINAIPDECFIIVKNPKRRFSPADYEEVVLEWGEDERV